MHLEHTPVALFMYSRPDLTRQVFARIRQVRPKRLLVVADGPRDNSDQVRCDECRQLVANVDWPCRLDTLFASENLGCRTRMASGLDWLFEQVESAIILEDDCVPHPDFFRFAGGLLGKYRSHSTVMMISGSQPLGEWRNQRSYAFSKYALIWGWATWRRAWAHYDVTMQRWPQFRSSPAFARVHEQPSERAHWDWRLQRAFEGHTTWDHQWSFAMWRRSGLAILPTINLVQNVGFGPDATHTKQEDQRRRLSIAAQPCRWPLLHPRQISREAAMDKVIFEALFNRDSGSQNDLTRQDAGA